MKKNNPKNQSIYIAILVIFLFTLLTLADVPASGTEIPVGLHALLLKENIIYTQEMDGLYCSEDGGFNWQRCNYDGEFWKEVYPIEYPKVVSLPDSEIQFLITSLGGIQISEDNGKTWQKLSSTFSLSEALSLSISEVNAANTNNQHFGAQDMLYDPITGNVIITIQSQGVIIIESNDYSITQVRIGESQP